MHDTVYDYRPGGLTWAEDEDNLHALMRQAQSEIDNLLEERTATCNKHGDFKYAAQVTEGIKHSMRDRVERADWMNYALDMIAGKMGRIEAGDPYYADHWRDIAGYATLVANELARSA